MAKQKCLIEGCEREVSCRGLCWACYQMARRAIRRGETTWEQLVAAWLALESSATRTASPFTAALKKAAVQKTSEPPKFSEGYEKSAAEGLIGTPEQMGSAPAEMTNLEDASFRPGSGGRPMPPVERMTGNLENLGGLAPPEEEDLLDRMTGNKELMEGMQPGPEEPQPADSATPHVPPARLEKWGGSPAAPKAMPVPPGEAGRIFREQLAAAKDGDAVPVPPEMQIAQAHAEQDGPTGIPHEALNPALMRTPEEIAADPTGDLGTRPRTEPEPMRVRPSLPDPPLSPGEEYQTPADRVEAEEVVKDSEYDNFNLSLDAKDFGNSSNGGSFSIKANRIPAVPPAAPVESPPDQELVDHEALDDEAWRKGVDVPDDESPVPPWKAPPVQPE